MKKVNNVHLLLKLLCLSIPIIVLTIMWFPVISHYHISNVSLTDKMVDSARNLPPDSLLDTLSGKEFRYGLSKSMRSDTALVMIAEKILSGQVEIPGLPLTHITIPFNPDDIDKGLPGWQLYMAGFLIPDILINAYEVSGRDEFLTTAKDIILGWARYERKVWLPKGLLWNDHAIASRSLVLSKFWRHYRSYHDFRSEEAADILQLAARSIRLLAKPSHFTFATNHGIIQNFALWHLCLSFPTLPDVERYKRLALERLDDQMKYYINDEGIVLEHSAGYHFNGLYNMGMAFRYLTLMGTPIPEHWNEKYEKAKKFYSELRRTDGSLPTYGDTEGYPDSSGPLVTSVDKYGRSTTVYFQKDWMPKQKNSIYPVAGYSIWWDGLEKWPDERELNQTVVAWSYFPGQAHKHADEMSVMLYAGGQTWWTNAGYWIYGTEGRAEAVSWSGSNAPHLVGEQAESERKTELKYHSSSDHLAVIDLERKGTAQYSARRQVIHYKPDLWIVIDSTSGDENSRTRTIWTTPSDVTLTTGKFTGSYYLQKANNKMSLQSYFINSNNSRIDHYKGSLEPFAGWVQNEPADALVLEQPASNSWSAAIWSLTNTDRSSLEFTGQPHMQNWAGPESWKIVLPVKKSQLSIWRDGNSIYVNKGNKAESIYELTLNKAPEDTTLKYAEIQMAYEKAARKYPKFKDLSFYLWKIMYAMIFLYIVQEFFFSIYKKRKGMHYTGLRIFAMTGWIGILVMWEIAVYFKG